MSDEKEIVLNKKKLTEEQFQEEKEKLESNKGIKVVEVGKDEFKTRIQE
jgi:hypothetical protein